MIPTDNGLSKFIEYYSMLSKRHVSAGATRLTEQQPHIVILQPHPDDVALSIGGLLGRLGITTSILTVFTESYSKCIRLSEDLAFAQLIGATAHYLDFVESSSSEFLSDIEAKAVLAAVAAKVERDFKKQSFLFAPAAVARHPDHRTVHEVAMHLGCSIFWEDVAFWGIYGSSIDDRVLFSHCRHFPIEDYTLIAVDISKQIEVKASMLSCYKSQSTDIWRPLRYAWTSARELGAPFAYCERLFVHDNTIIEVERMLHGSLVRTSALRYGTATVRTGWIRD